MSVVHIVELRERLNLAQGVFDRHNVKKKSRMNRVLFANNETTQQEEKENQMIRCTRLLD
jgi:hypothetical protein